MSPVERSSPPAPRHYEIGGERYVRVSTVLGMLNKPSLAAWRGRVGNDEADRVSKVATDFGTRLHAAIEQVNGGDSFMVFEPDLMPHAEAYYGWKEANVARVVACERRCISHDHRYAGTADCLVELKTGELALLDYKSSKAGPWDGRKLEHALQLAAYRLALAEEGLIVRHRLILQLPSNEPGRLIVHEYEHHKADTLAFLACLAIYRYVEQHWGGQP